MCKTVILMMIVMITASITGCTQTPSGQNSTDIDSTYTTPMEDLSSYDTPEESSSMGSGTGAFQEPGTIDNDALSQTPLEDLSAYDTPEESPQGTGSSAFSMEYNNTDIPASSQVNPLTADNKTNVDLSTVDSFSGGNVATEEEFSDTSETISDTLAPSHSTGDPNSFEAALANEKNNQLLASHSSTTGNNTQAYGQSYSTINCHPEVDPGPSQGTGPESNPDKSGFFQDTKQYWKNRRENIGNRVESGEIGPVRATAEDMGTRFMEYSVAGPAAAEEAISETKYDIQRGASSEEITRDLLSAAGHTTLALAEYVPAVSTVTKGTKLIPAVKHGGQTIKRITRITKVGKYDGPATEIKYVTRWGRPGLKDGDFVMVGKRNRLNYTMSGKWQPGGGNRYASYSSGETYVVPSSSISAPSKAATAVKGVDTGPSGWLKWLMGQRSYSTR